MFLPRFPVWQLQCGTKQNDVRGVLSGWTEQQSFTFVAACCRIRTTALCCRLRFLSVPAAAQRARYASFSRCRSNRRLIFRVLIVSLCSSCFFSDHETASHFDSRTNSIFLGTNPNPTLVIRRRNEAVSHFQYTTTTKLECFALLRFPGSIPPSFWPDDSTGIPVHGEIAQTASSRQTGWQHLWRLLSTSVSRENWPIYRYRLDISLLGGINAWFFVSNAW